MKKKEDNRIGKIKAVMFVPYTHHSELAIDLRQAEEKGWHEARGLATQVQPMARPGLQQGVVPTM